MNAFSKALAGLAFSAVAATSAPAAAATIVNFAQYQQLNAGDTMRWTQSAAKTGGTLTDIGDPTVIFRLWDTSVAPGDEVEVLAKFDFYGVVSNGTPAMSMPGLVYQGGMSGNFSFTSLQAFSRNGVDYAAGTNLLSAVFTGGNIMGAGTGSVNGDALSGASVDYASAVFDTSAFFQDTFTISLNAIRRGSASGLSAATGKSLKDFTATTTGQFSAAAVPEPAAWAMMISGFFMAGGMMRSRRRLGSALAR